MAKEFIGDFSILSPSQKKELERKRQEEEARKAAEEAKKAEAARKAQEQARLRAKTTDFAIVVGIGVLCLLIIVIVWFWIYFFLQLIEPAVDTEGKVGTGIFYFGLSSIIVLPILFIIGLGIYELQDKL